MYPFCFYFEVPSTAYVTLIVVNLFIGLTGTLATYILELFPNDPELNNIAKVLKDVFLIFPNYCLGRGLMDIADNEYLTVFNDLGSQFGESAYQQFQNPLSWGIVGKNVFAMIVQGFIFFGVTLLFEFYRIKHMTAKASLWSRLKRLLRIKSKHASDASYLKSTRDLATEDGDVARERALVSTAGQEQQQAVLVKDLSKIYGNNAKNRKVAVNKLCFTVRKGECFGLLGVNGAVGCSLVSFCAVCLLKSVFID
jgi:hypothetical protein